MNWIEYLCVIVGAFILFDFVNTSKYTNAKWYDMIIFELPNLLKLFIAGLMVILPLYFNFWK